MATSATKPPSQQAPPAQQREVRWLPIESLLLDPLNPRLPDGMEKASQDKLLQALAEDYNLQDLGQSLANNGYFAEEPLVAVPAKAANTWTVVEGNRRLAALKLLDQPALAPKNLQKTWEQLSQSRKKQVTAATVLVYDKRSDVIPYLGYRHITGVLEWAPYQKARYIAQLVEKHGRTFVEIAREIGSKAPNVREHYVAFSMVRQAREDFAIDTSRVEQSFGVLRRALSDPDIRSFAGVQLGGSEKELRAPIPEKRQREVHELFVWMFGGPKTSPVLTDSRDLRKLGSVLAKAETVEILRSSRSLGYAFELSGGEEQRLIEYLAKVQYNLDQSLPMLVRHKARPKVVQALTHLRETFEAVLKLISK